MHRKLKRRKLTSDRTTRNTWWFWTSQGLLIKQQAYLGTRECDKRHPASHYNLHIQPSCGGLDYHNYHIRYIGMKEHKHIWSVVDAPYGIEKSHRVYSLSKEQFIPELIDTASSLVVTDVTNDVGDPTLWIKLYDYLAFVLLDLYRQDFRKETIK